MSETVFGAWLGRFASVIQEFGLYRAEKDHSVFWGYMMGRGSF